MWTRRRQRSSSKGLCQAVVLARHSRSLGKPNSLVATHKSPLGGAARQRARERRAGGGPAPTLHSLQATSLGHTRCALRVCLLTGRARLALQPARGRLGGGGRALPAGARRKPGRRGAVQRWQRSMWGGPFVGLQGHGASDKRMPQRARWWPAPQAGLHSSPPPERGQGSHLHLVIVAALPALPAPLPGEHRQRPLTSLYTLHPSGEGERAAGGNEADEAETNLGGPAHAQASNCKGEARAAVRRTSDGALTCMRVQAPPLGTPV